MKRVDGRQIGKPWEYAADGGQALYVYHPLRWPSAPRVFQREAKVGWPWAYLFDMDAGRLAATARRLGVRVVRIHREGMLGQHVDLCGEPLRRAVQECGLL